MTNEATENLYGNWKRPDSPGILGLGEYGTFIFVGHIFVAILVVMMNLVVGIVWLVLGSLLLYVVVRKDKHNMSILYRRILKFNFTRQRNAHRGIYRSGPLSHIPFGQCRLPSIAANTSLASYYDPQGREIGVLVHNNHFVTLVLKSEPEGSGLLDIDTVNQQVARYGAFLNNLNNEPGLVSTSVTIESEPENGLKLKSEINNHLTAESSDFSKATMLEISDLYPVNSSSIYTYTALTYSMKKLNADKRDFDSIMHEIITRLPMLASQLESSGAGVCKTMTSLEVFKMIRVAYDPKVKDEFDVAEQSGEEILVDWANVGPTIAINEWDKYTTDSGVHRTYIMTSPPRGVVPAGILERLLQPHKDFSRKRVTILYKPMSFEQSATKVEEDLTNAQFKANSEKRATARQQMAINQAAQTAAEEARGSTLVSFGVIITVTVPNSESITSADAVINNLSASSHIMLRSANGTQDSAFIAGLPLGISLDRFYSFFDDIKEKL